MTTALIIIAISVLFVSAILERFSIATILIIAGCVCYHFWYGNIFVFFSENYKTIIAGAFIYVILGVIWSFVKWVLFLYEFKRFRDKNIKERPYTYYQGVLITNTPKASEFKLQIITWMCWWPLSAIGTLINDPVRRFFRFLFETLSGTYQKLADSIVPKIDPNKED